MLVLALVCVSVLALADVVDVKEIRLQLLLAQMEKVDAAAVLVDVIAVVMAAMVVLAQHLVLVVQIQVDLEAPILVQALLLEQDVEDALVLVLVHVALHVQDIVLEVALETVQADVRGHVKVLHLQVQPVIAIVAAEDLVAAVRNHVVENAPVTAVELAQTDVTLDVQAAAMVAAQEAVIVTVHHVLDVLLHAMEDVSLDALDVQAHVMEIAKVTVALDVLEIATEIVNQNVLVAVDRHAEANVQMHVMAVQELVAINALVDAVQYVLDVLVVARDNA